MERWEYQVIHLNVESQAAAPPSAPPAQPPSAEPAPGAPPIRVEEVFSREYLEKEFPGFYGAPPPAGTPAKEHPANQLRSFLNLQGRDGWQLLGFYPVGELTMMIFRRPLAADPPVAEQAAALPAPPLAGTGPAEASEPPGQAVSAAGGEAPEAQADVLMRILARLEALERRLPSQSPLQPPPQSQPPLAPPAVAAATAEPAALAGVRDGEILPPQGLAALAGLPQLPTPEAARALGFRSAASLLNLAARSGYLPGLVKRGADASLAVYVGSEKSARGGRERRLWVVLRDPAG